MATYIKATNFASKDALLTGNPLKIVSGTEIDDEFNAIQTAINTKADTNSPTLTGTPIAPTATAGTSNTQLATTAFVTGADTTQTNAITSAYQAADTALQGTLQGNINLKANIASPVFTGNPTAPTPAPNDNDTSIATTAFVTTALNNYQSVVNAALQAIYPVGSIYTNATVSTNPATLVGFGTWVAFGTGRVMVGIDGGDASFDTLGETGGTKDIAGHTHTTGSHTLTTSQIPPHNHTIHPSGGFVELNSSVTPGSAGGYQGGQGLLSGNITGSTGSGGSHNHGNTGTGGALANGNLQPYVVVYMWKRIS